MTPVILFALFVLIIIVLYYFVTPQGNKSKSNNTVGEGYRHSTDQNAGGNTPAPLAPPLPTSGTPIITKLLEEDRGNHKLSITKLQTPQAVVIMAEVAMSFNDYTELLLRLDPGDITQERALINKLVHKIFSDREKGIRVFASETEYQLFIHGIFPGYVIDARNHWFKVAALRLPVSGIYTEEQAIGFLDQQSVTYSREPKLETPILPNLPPPTAKPLPSYSPRPQKHGSTTSIQDKLVSLTNTTQPVTQVTTAAQSEVSSEQSPRAASIQVKREDWLSFQNLLKAHNITKLYHFTDRANLESIRKTGGLLSWYSCQQRNIEIPKPGGSPSSWSLDSNKGLADYVRLSFIHKHPMMYVAKNEGRIHAPVVLEIDPEVIFWQSTKFTSVNAVMNGARAFEGIDEFSKLEFQLFKKSYFDLEGNDKHRYQAEILVHQMLPAQYILNRAQVGI